MRIVGEVSWSCLDVIIREGRAQEKERQEEGRREVCGWEIKGFLWSSAHTHPIQDHNPKPNSGLFWRALSVFSFVFFSFSIFLFLKNHPFNNCFTLWDHDFSLLSLINSNLLSITTMIILLQYEWMNVCVSDMMIWMIVEANILSLPKK